jgi:hypothetical protein
MFRLRKVHPPYGTKEAPVREHAYSEEVTVVNGACEVREITTRDFLLKTGYEEINEEAGATMENGDTATARKHPGKPKGKKKKKR